MKSLAAPSNLVVRAVSPNQIVLDGRTIPMMKKALSLKENQTMEISLKLQSSQKYHQIYR